MDILYKECNLNKRLRDEKYPIDIDIGNCTKIKCAQLHCNYFDEVPLKLKLVNTGTTALIRGVWPANRPCLIDGPLKDKYIFSQLHFHWGKKPTEGSNHTVDTGREAMEMHLVFFKRKYIYPEVARGKADGIIIMVYIMQFQIFNNPRLKDIVDKLGETKLAGSECLLPSIPLSTFVPTFMDDFLVYRAPVCDVPAIWIISRIPVTISESQIKAFQALQNPNEVPIVNCETECFRPKKTKVWYVNPTSSQIATLVHPR